MFYNFTIFKNWEEELKSEFTHRKKKSNYRGEITRRNQKRLDWCSAEPRQEVDPSERPRPICLKKLSHIGLKHRDGMSALYFFIVLVLTLNWKHAERLQIRLGLVVRTCHVGLHGRRNDFDLSWSVSQYSLVGGTLLYKHQQNGTAVPTHTRPPIWKLVVPSHDELMEEKLNITVFVENKRTV